VNHRKIAVLGFLIATIAGLTIVSLGTADTSESGDTLSVSDNQSTNETLEGLAESFYNTDDVAVYEVQDSRFFDGFPNHDLDTVYELEQYPAETHTLAVSSADELRDVTEDYNVLLNDAGVLLDSSSDAQLYAEALAQTANPEDLPLRERQLVNASDSDRLNHSIEDPVVETQGTGWKVQLHTYSPENGYIAEWTVYTGLEEVTEANFQIEAVGNGPSETSIETAALSTDYKIYNDYDG
jgi:hypothetical protein